ncbi:MAG TPA: HEPN domain-containing protein [Prolixibacteraceae bacterium]|jgi:hypothetical protein|nr:HEPN domain-containing protein [Prolixibacteraceae bacterium]
MTGTTSDYIKYRIEKADDSFSDAKLLFSNQRWNACVNRLYYSCFYITIALLVKNDIETTTHDGVRNQLGKVFVKTGIIEKQLGKLYSKLFDYRLKGDYGDWFDFDEKLVTPLIPEVEKYLSRLKELIDL